jgi:hypothetical protein
MVNTHLVGVATVRFGEHLMKLDRPKAFKGAREPLIVPRKGKNTETKQSDEALKVGQKRPTLERFTLRVDRQVKSSFASFDEAEKIAKTIKNKYPVVEVSIYDTQEQQQKILS